MKQIKIFSACDDRNLQFEIDKWIKKNNVNVDIISASSSVGCSQHGTTYYITTMLYEETQDIKL